MEEGGVGEGGGDDSRYTKYVFSHVQGQENSCIREISLGPL